MDAISKEAVGILRKLAMAVHLQHEKAYSWWKWKESKTAAPGPMSHVKRALYVKLRLELAGALKDRSARQLQVDGVLVSEISNDQ